MCTCLFHKWWNYLTGPFSTTGEPCGNLGLRHRGRVMAPAYATVSSFGLAPGDHLELVDIGSEVRQLVCAASALWQTVHAAPTHCQSRGRPDAAPCNKSAVRLFIPADTTAPTTGGCERRV